jgi:hypothetical protein
VLQQKSFFSSGFNEIHAKIIRVSPIEPFLVVVIRKKAAPESGLDKSGCPVQVLLRADSHAGGAYGISTFCKADEDAVARRIICDRCTGSSYEYAKCGRAIGADGNILSSSPRRRAGTKCIGGQISILLIASVRPPVSAETTIFPALPTLEIATAKTPTKLPVVGTFTRPGSPDVASATISAEPAAVDRKVSEFRPSVYSADRRLAQ